MFTVLQTRPDLNLIVIGGLVVLVVFLVKAAEDAIVDPKTASPKERRDMINAALGITLAVFLSAYLLPSSISMIAEESCALIIESGETYLIDSGEREEYCECSIDGGVLKLEGTLALSDTYG